MSADEWNIFQHAFAFGILATLWVELLALICVDLFRKGKR